MAKIVPVYADEQPVEQRRARRRPVRLAVSSTNSAAAESATIRNLSESGLLIEANVGFAVGDAVTLELPVAGAVAGRVAWARHPFYGCAFDKPVSRAAVSAALLRSPIDEPEHSALGPASSHWDFTEEPETAPVRVGAGPVVAMGALGALLIAVLVTLA